MILFKYYDKDKRLEKVWYKSSNIIYSECDDNENALKTLRIVFKKGDLYEYKDVDVKDYIMFTAGGLDDSNGKAFFKFIKPKYEYEKKGQVDLDAINEDMLRCVELWKKSGRCSEEPAYKTEDDDMPTPNGGEEVLSAEEKNL